MEDFFGGKKSRDLLKQLLSQHKEDFLKTEENRLNKSFPFFATAAENATNNNNNNNNDDDDEDEDDGTSPHSKEIIHSSITEQLNDQIRNRLSSVRRRVFSLS